MKTYNFTTPTRQALRSLVKLMKQEGLTPVSNEKTRTSDQSWQCKLITGTLVINADITPTPKKKHFKVVNNKAIAA